MRLDALIFGGGAAGLWLLDRLSRDGHHVLLLESRALGAGQTVASQGILHAPSPTATTKAIKNRQAIARYWQDSLLGRATPNLSRTRLRSGHCFLWQADYTTSRNAATSSRVSPFGEHEILSQNDRPDVLRHVIGPIAKVPELVIDPRSLVQDLSSQYADRILLIDDRKGLEFQLDSPGEVTAVRLVSPADRSVLELRPRQVILTAGSGNGRLRKMTELSSDVVQRRPLHTILVRGDLPELNGHCLDGSDAHLTITSDYDEKGRVIWQLGGGITDDGRSVDSQALIERAYSQLSIRFPGMDLSQTEWTTYTIDRAEAATTNGAAPRNIQVLCAGNVTTGWPTKLVLAPALAHEIASRATSPYFSEKFDTSRFAKWPRPDVAQVPWMEADFKWWKRDEKSAADRRRAA